MRAEDMKITKQDWDTRVQLIVKAELLPLAHNP